MALINDKKPVIAKLKEEVPESEGKNEMSEKIDDVIKEVGIAEKKIDDCKAEVEDLINAAELFDESLSNLEKWQPKTTVLEEPIGLTKEAVVEQLDDLKVI